MQLVELAEGKKAAIQDQLEATLGDLASVQALTEHYLEITAPEARFPEVEFRRLTIGEGGANASSG